ncbi:MAG: hypothetical protein OXI66_12525, partial [Boseongicola sp.]|nr:hypothetical protein [Boseongicola sp.]
MGESRSTQGVHGGEIAQYTGKAVFSAYYVQKCHTRAPETAVSRSFVTGRRPSGTLEAPGFERFRRRSRLRDRVGAPGRGSRRATGAAGAWRCRARRVTVLSLAPCRTGFVFAASSADEV